MGDDHSVSEGRTTARARARAAARLRRDLEAALAPGPGRALVAVDGSPVLDVEQLRRDHSGATLEVLDVRSGDRPTGEGFLAVVDATRRSDLRRGLFEATFPRLLPGGSFLVLDHRPTGSDATGPVAEDVLWPRLVGTDAFPLQVGRVVLDEQHLCVERSKASGPRVIRLGPGPTGVVRGLVRGERPTIAVVGGRRAPWVAARLRRALPRAQLVLVGITAPESGRHVELATYGRFDLIVDATFDAAASASLVRTGLLHVRRGGSMLVLDGSPLRRDPAGSTVFWQTVTDVLSRRGSPPVYEPGPELEWSRLATAIGRVDVGPRHVVLMNRVTALAVIRDRQLRRVAQGRNDPAIQIHERRPGHRFTSRASLGESTERDPRRMPETYQVPELQVHEYRDVTCAPRQVVTQGNLVLPDTFRHPDRVWLQNRRLEPMGRLFARGMQRPTQRLEGSYFHLDGELRHHFGHVLTEQLSRLWAWPAAKAADPGLRALMSLGPNQPALPEWHLSLYEAAGVPRSDMVTFRAPVLAQRLVGATPMFSMPDYVHPGIAEVWDRVGAALDSQATLDTPPERIFVTRAPGSDRWCHETPDLERIFTEHGYAVIRPELLPLPDQARLFRRAKAVAGFAGSNMLNLMFATDPKPVLLIRSTIYTAVNEYMIASVRGDHLEIMAGPAELRSGPERPGGRAGWAKRPSDSGRRPFHFDLRADRSLLEQILGTFP